MEALKGIKAEDWGHGDIHEELHVILSLNPSMSRSSQSASNFTDTQPLQRLYRQHTKSCLQDQADKKL